MKEDAFVRLSTNRNVGSCNHNDVRVDNIQSVFLPCLDAQADSVVIDHGLGRHIWVGPPDAAVAWAKGLFISEVSYTCLICSVKFSLLAFYWRIFKHSRIRIPIYFLGTVVSAWGIAVVRGGGKIPIHFLHIVS